MFNFNTDYFESFILLCKNICNTCNPINYTNKIIIESLMYTVEPLFANKLE